MRKALVIVAALLSLSSVSCTPAEMERFQTVEKVAVAVISAKVPAEAVLVAVNSFDIIREGATGYLVYCKTHLSQPVCSRGNRRLVIRYGRQGTVARNRLEDAISEGQPAGPRDLYDALISATSSLKSSPAQQFVGAK